MSKRMRNVNVCLLFLAAFLFGFATLTSPISVLTQNAQDMFAAVGVTMSVAPNPYNTVAAQLQLKETALKQKEQQLASRENAQASQPLTAPSNRYSFYSLCMSIVLCILVAINFYFDVRRKGRADVAKRFSVDLR